MYESGVPLARILIVDDEALIVRLLGDFLQNHGYATTGCTSASRAWSIFQKGKFDLLITDMEMPEMGGIALLRMAIKTDSDLAGIIITGAGTIATAVEAMQTGALDYIQKPLELRVILPVIARVLTVRRLRLENMDLRQQVRDSTAQLRFFSIVSHELRTPLNKINGWLQLLRGGLLTPEKTAHGLEVIDLNVAAQIRITESLLDISRIITGKLQLVTQPTLLPSVIDAVVETVRPAAIAKNIQLNVVLDRFADPVAADSERLPQIIWHLLSNAIKFTPQDGGVDVVLKQTADGSLVMSVSDTGRGIPAQFLPHIFDHFWQHDGTSTRTHGGLGLGLSLVRYLVELHGGTVTASSPGEGKGSSFTVRLPGIRTKAA